MFFILAHSVNRFEYFFWCHSVSRSNGIIESQFSRMFALNSKKSLSVSDFQQLRPRVRVSI